MRILPALIILLSLLLCQFAKAWTHGASTGPTGLVVNLTFDASAQAAPPAFRTAMNSAASALMAQFSTPVTINITVSYDTTTNPNGASTTEVFFGGASYTSIYAGIGAYKAGSASATAYYNALPNASSIQGHTGLSVTRSSAKVLGLLAARDPGNDGTVTVGSGLSAGILVGVGLHEMSHAMGRSAGDALFDLGRFTATNVRVISASSNSAYFSTNNGATNLANYDTSNSDQGDFDSSGTTINDPFAAIYNIGSPQQSLTAMDIQLLNTLGFQ